MTTVYLKELVRRKIGYGIVQPSDSRFLSIPVIKVNNIISGLNSVDALDKTSQTISQKYSRTVLQGGELLVSVVGTIGKTAIVPNSFAGCNIARAVAMIDIQDPILAMWVKYYIDSPQGQAYIIENLNTTVQATLNIKDLENMPVPLFNRSQLERRVAVLRSLDDKMALNNRINHNLEEQAQALYKSWFVDFEPFKDGAFEVSELGLIPVGWNVKKIGELPLFIADYVANGSFASLKENVRLYESENYAVFVRNTDLKAGSFPIFVDAHSYNFLSKTKLSGGEIIISNVGDVGSVHFCPRLNRPMTLGNNVIMIKAEDKRYYAFLYLCFKYFSGHYSIEGITGGSAMPKFNKTDFKGIKLIIPSSDILSRFDDIASSLFHRIELNKRECEELSSQRDTLLPAFMSGQLTC